MTLFMKLAIFLAASAAFAQDPLMHQSAHIFKPMTVNVPAEMQTQIQQHGITEDQVAQLADAAQPARYVSLLKEFPTGAIVIMPPAGAINFRIVIVKSQGVGDIFYIEPDEQGCDKFLIHAGTPPPGAAGSIDHAEATLSIMRQKYGQMNPPGARPFTGCMGSRGPDYSPNVWQTNKFLRPMYIYPSREITNRVNSKTLTLQDAQQLLAGSNPHEHLDAFYKASEVTALLSDPNRFYSELTAMLVTKQDGATHYWLLGVPKDNCQTVLAHFTDKPGSDERKALTAATSAVGWINTGGVFETRAFHMSCMLR